MATFSTLASSGIVPMHVTLQHMAFLVTDTWGGTDQAMCFMRVD